jgi:sporulation protein YqfC
MMRKRKLEGIKANISEMFELPKEIVLNLPKISMVGNNQMYVEIHKGIIEYTPQRIRVNSTIGVIRILGEEMTVKNIGAEEIIVTGEILSIEFLV